MTYTLVRATESDLDTVVGLLTARAKWLAREGHDQWSEKDPARTSEATITTGETWLLMRDGDAQPVGTLTMTTRADRDFWDVDELGTPALYLSKLATRTDLAGQGLGRVLLYAAARYGRDRGAYKLRWDVWRTNAALREYYAGVGANFIRSMEVTGRRSGALFDWHEADTPLGQGGLGGEIRIDAPTGVLLELPSALTWPTQILGQEFMDPTQSYGPSHWHHIAGLTAEDPDGIRPGAGRPLVIPGMPGPTILFHSGDTWRVARRVSSPVAGAVLDQLTPGLLYQVTEVGVGSESRAVIVGDALDREPTAHALPEAVPFS